MDITLLRYGCSPDGFAHFSFNPCFNGYYTFTRLCSKEKSGATNVSILVLMDITLLRYLTSSLVLEVVMFQSLF